MEKNETVTLTMSEDEAKVVARALRMMQDLHMGRIDRVFDPLVGHLFDQGDKTLITSVRPPSTPLQTFSKQMERLGDFAHMMARASKTEDGVTFLPITYRSTIADLATIFGAVITGNEHGGPGIGNKLVANEARIARRMEAKIKGDEGVLSLYAEDGSPRER